VEEALFACGLLEDGASGSAGGFGLAAACAIDEDKPDDFGGSVTVLVAALVESVELEQIKK
jgi:hypothetical protein